LREFLQLHKAVHGAGGTYGLRGASEQESAVARAIAAYRGSGSLDDEADDDDTFDDEQSSLSRTTSLVQSIFVVVVVVDD
jgi:hypothetical protein